MGERVAKMVLEVRPARGSFVVGGRGTANEAYEWQQATSAPAIISWLLPLFHLMDRQSDGQDLAVTRQFFGTTGLGAVWRQIDTGDECSDSLDSLLDSRKEGESEMPGKPQSTSRMTRRAALQMGGAGAALAGLLLANQLPEASAQDSRQSSILGAWMTNAVSTTAGVTSSLLAFSLGGTVIQVNTNHPTQSPGIGAWADAGDGTILYSYIKLMFDASGAYVGSLHINARLTVADDGSSYSSRFDTEIQDSQGNTVTTGRGTAQATRIVAVPPTS